MVKKCGIILFERWCAMKLITRTQYLEKLINVIGTPDIKVITGVRRSGKSKLLESFKNYIEQNVPDHNIIGINFNLPSLTICLSTDLCTIISILSMWQAKRTLF